MGINHGLIAEARSWLIQKECGLLTHSEFMRLIDQKILDLSNVPDYLIALSMGESLFYTPQLDLDQSPATTQDCIIIAQKIIHALETRVSSFDDLALLSLKMCCLLDPKEPAYESFSWINDEIPLMKDGIKDQQQSKKDILLVLESLCSKINPTER